MPLPIEFRPVEDEYDLRRLTQFMTDHDLGYPGYLDWVNEKLSPRIETGYALGIFAVYQNIVIGNAAIYPFSEQHRAELKNFRVDDNYEDEGVGAFLWRQAELEARKACGLGDDEPLELYLDTPADNVVALQFFRRKRCSEIGRVPLYTPERRDVLLKKTVPAPRRRTAA